MANNSILASMSVALTANVSGFNRGMAEARKNLAGFKKAGEEMKGFGENLSKYISAPLAGLAAVSLKTSGDLQSLKKGLESVTGSAEAADARFKLLQQSTKGLDLSTVTQADVSLQASGVAADKSLKSIQEFGNALKTVGKGSAADLKGALYGVQQLAATDFPMAEDLNIIKEAVPQVGKLLKEAFGTSRSEELAKLGVSSGKVLDTILTGLEKLPRVSGGLNSSFEGLTANLKNMGAAFGESINKNLKVEESLAALSEKVGMLATGFSNLSPSTQKFLVVGAALAAAIGPILFGVGALAAAIPTLAAGFAVLTGPVGLVVAGFVALSVAAVKTFSSVKTTSRSFEDQKKHVANLQGAFVPLINRYDELKAKSSLSKEEQTELNSIIAQIAKTTPDAIAQFDKYGKAMDISSAKAREFVKTQQGILAFKNKEQTAELVAEFKKIDKEVEKLQAKFAKGIEIEVKQTETARGVGMVKTERTLTNEEKQDLGYRIAALQQEKEAIRGLVAELNGMPPIIKEIAAANEDAGNKSGFTPEQLTALQSIQDALSIASKEYKVHGDAMQYTKDKSSILESGWKSLIKNGLDPQSESVRNIATQWKVAEAAIEAYNKRIVELPKVEMSDDITSIFASPQLRDGLKLKVDLVPVNLTAFEASLSAAEQLVESFSANASSLVNGLIADSFVLLGETIGAALSGGNAAETFFNGFLVMLADFAGQFGKLLITTALAASGLMATLSNPASWPLALAAGVALVAAAGIAKAHLAKGIGRGSTPSAPRSASPNYGSSFAGSGYGQGQVEFKIQGDALVGVINRTDYRTKRFAG